MQQRVFVKRRPKKVRREQTKPLPKKGGGGDTRGADELLAKIDAVLAEAAS